jgi:hypothetical protein
MKTIIIIFFIIALTSDVCSQVTLTNGNNPAAGNTQMIIDCDTNEISQGNTGTNQTWNFTSLTRLDSNLLSWVTASSTPYSAQFSSSNIASTNDNLSYNYFTTGASNLYTNGTASPTTVIPYTDTELYLQYPFTYNSSFSDNFAASYNQAGNQTYRTGIINVTGDAWGTINLPFGSFQNALRVKYVLHTRDSSNSGTPIVFVTDLTSYVWFVPGRKFPVFEIIYNSISFNGVPFGTTKLVNYNSNSTPIGITPISAEVPRGFRLGQNYPNPFNPVTNINMDIQHAGSVKLVVYDILGNEIETLINDNLTAGSYKVDWNAASYPSGVYYYRLTSGNFSDTKQLILIK